MHWHRRLCVYIFVHTYLPIYTHILILFFDSYLCICIFVLPCAVTVMFMYAQMCIHINFLYTYTHLCVRVCVCVWCFRVYENLYAHASLRATDAYTCTHAHASTLLVLQGAAETQQKHNTMALHYLCCGPSYIEASYCILWAAYSLRLPVRLS